MTNSQNDKQNPPVFDRSMPLTFAVLHDLLSRAHSVIRESDGADEHAPLIGELSEAVFLIASAIGSSHMGTAATMPVFGDVLDAAAAALDARPPATTPWCMVCGFAVCRCASTKLEDTLALAPPDGWTLYHTGGGCYCWQKEFPSGIYIWLTDDDAAAPSDPAQPVMLGLYADESVCMAMLTARDLAHALDLAASVAMIGEHTTGQHDGTPHDDGSFTHDPHCTCNTCMEAFTKDQLTEGWTSDDVYRKRDPEGFVREQVIVALGAFNVKATHEYPGYLAVQFNGQTWNCGTANGDVWGADVEGDSTQCFQTTIPADCTDANVIAQGILVALLQQLAEVRR